jgi:hypothetical protein
MHRTLTSQTRAVYITRGPDRFDLVGRNSSLLDHFRSTTDNSEESVFHA